MPVFQVLLSSGLRLGLPGAARIAAERLAELRLDDAFAVGDAVARVAPETAAAIVKRDGGADTRNHASAEIFIGLGARGEVQRDAANRPVAEIEIAALIVAAEMADAEEGDVSVFDFVLVAGSGGEICDRCRRCSR